MKIWAKKEGKMSKTNYKFVVSVILMLFLNLMLIHAADLDLRITSVQSGIPATFYTETDSYCNDGKDGNDMTAQSPPSEENYSIFYSVIGTGAQNFTLDCWNITTTGSKTRTMYLVIKSSVNTFPATLTWNALQSNFAGTLSECTYSDFTGCSSNAVSLAAQALTTTVGAGDMRYFRLAVTYTPQCTGPNCGGQGSSGGSGGGGSETSSTSMRIDLPKPVSIEETGPVEFNITLKNDGENDLTDVNLVGSLILNSKSLDVPVVFDKKTFAQLLAGQNETINVRTRIDSDEISIYEILINATSKDPAYKTQSKVYLTFIGKDGSGIVKIVAFTQGMIDENAECAELSSMLDEARKLIDEGNAKDGLLKAQEALDACKKILEGPKNPIYSPFQKNNTLLYVGIAIGLAILFGIIFNLYKLWRFGKFKKTKSFKSEKPDLNRFHWR